MRDLVAIVLLLTPALAQEQEQELNIEKYEFIWEAYHAQGVEISVMKNETTTRFSLRSEGGWLTMSAQEALRLAEELSMVLRLRTVEENSEGKNSNLVKGPPFSIWGSTGSTLTIMPDDRSFSFALNVEQAKAIVPYLEKAPRMIAFVDSLIHF